MICMTNTNTLISGDLDRYRRILVDKFLFIKNRTPVNCTLVVLSIDHSSIDIQEEYTVGMYELEKNSKYDFLYVPSSWLDLAVLACQEENLGTYMNYSRFHNDPYAIMVLQ